MKRWIKLQVLKVKIKFANMIYVFWAKCLRSFGAKFNNSFDYWKSLENQYKKLSRKK